MDIVDEARKAVAFGLEWTGGESPEKGSAVEILQRMIVEVERLRAMEQKFLQDAEC